MLHPVLLLQSLHTGPSLGGVSQPHISSTYFPVNSLEVKYGNVGLNGGYWTQVVSQTGKENLSRISICV